MEKPILFNTEMVRAILAGRKTQTRRLIRPQPEGQLSYIFGGCHPGKWTYMSRSEAKAWDVDESVIHEEEGKYWTPPCNGDDMLYVRETWARPSKGEMTNGSKPNMYVYRADYPSILAAYDKWRPSIHMPKEAARIWLNVKRVRVERLKDITEEDAVAEGLEADDIFKARERFAMLWNSTYGVAGKQTPENWASNPWVWVIEFERMEGRP